MAEHDMIVIGASAGGVEALTTLVRQLPADFPGTLFVVLHVPAGSPSLLPDILSRAGPLKALHPRDGEPVEPGRIYVAPPDYHLLLEEDRVHLVHGPKENRHRPAIDPLFRSAAREYGQRVVGVILTGMLNDGTAGLLAVKRSGGLAVIQNPDEALYPDMPLSALRNVEVDYRVNLAEMGALLSRLARQETPVLARRSGSEQNLAKEIGAVEMETAPFDEKELAGTPSVYSCPECGGVLWEIQDGTLLRFRCRIGHALSAENVLIEQTEQVENALSNALKSLEEKASLSLRMARQAREGGHSHTAQYLEAKAVAVEEDARVLRQLLARPVFNDGEKEAL